MHNIGWRENYFNSYYVSMLGHGCGVSQFPQFYDIYIYILMTEKNIDDNGSVIFPKQMLRKIDNEKYQETYANRAYVISKYYKTNT